MWIASSERWESVNGAATTLVERRTSKAQAIFAEFYSLPPSTWFVEPFVLCDEWAPLRGQLSTFLTSSLIEQAHLNWNVGNELVSWSRPSMITVHFRVVLSGRSENGFTALDQPCQDRVC